MKFPFARISSILFLLIIIGFFSFSLYRKHKIRHIIEITLSGEHWKERMAEFTAQPRTQGHIVFLGNSLTELFNLEILGDSTLINRGITGDFTEGMYSRIDEVISLQPSRLFMEIGINDLVEHVPVKDVIRNYKATIERVKEKSPSTRIYIQSILPVRMEDSWLTSTADVNEVVLEANEALKKLATEEQATYVDLHDNFYTNGAINPRLTWDGVHLVDEGYGIWKNLLQPYLH
ncbi:MAG TPA: GDSL-type esterase/lipase family protein [Bacteroidia bacterium]|jgi:hexosaminidase|nr:GDSL-type esterase/lipase family protein [Bacteroidia bacterium]